MYTWPKRFMRTRELVEMGFVRGELREAYEHAGQRCARKISPDKRNSPIIYDTEELGKYLERKTQQRMARL